jgi:hypothetical protein
MACVESELRKRSVDPFMVNGVIVYWPARNVVLPTTKSNGIFPANPTDWARAPATMNKLARTTSTYLFTESPFVDDFAIRTSYISET